MLIKMPTDGGTPVTLATVAEQANLGGVVIDDTDVYVVDTGFAGVPGAVYKVSQEGGSLITVAREQDHPLALALDETRVYWLTGEGELKQAPRDGGAATVLATEQSGIADLAVDRTSLYWTSKMEAGAVMKMDK